MKLRETCGCGALFEADLSSTAPHRDSDRLQELVRSWRKEHLHTLSQTVVLQPIRKVS